MSAVGTPRRHAPMRHIFFKKTGARSQSAGPERRVAAWINGHIHRGTKKRKNEKWCETQAARPPDLPFFFSLVVFIPSFSGHAASIFSNFSGYADGERRGPDRVQGKH